MGRTIVESSQFGCDESRSKIQLGQTWTRRDKPRRFTQAQMFGQPEEILEGGRGGEKRDERDMEVGSERRGRGVERR